MQGHLKGTFLNKRHDFLPPSYWQIRARRAQAFPEAVWLKSSLVSADLQSEAISTTFVESASASCELRAPKMLGFLATNIFHSNPS